MVSLVASTDEWHVWQTDSGTLHRRPWTVDWSSRCPDQFAANRQLILPTVSSFAFQSGPGVATAVLSPRYWQELPLSVHKTGIHVHWLERLPVSSGSIAHINIGLAILPSHNAWLECRTGSLLVSLISSLGSSWTIRQLLMWLYKHCPHLHPFPPRQIGDHYPLSASAFPCFWVL